MDEQKKQKVLLALVVALVLGAGGSYWFFGRDAGSAANRMIENSPAQRMQRTKVTTAKRQHKRHQESGERIDARVTQRKVRDERKHPGSSPNKRRRPQRKVKKQKVAPAG